MKQYDAEVMREACAKVARGWAEHYAGGDGEQRRAERLCDDIADDIAALPLPAPLSDLTDAQWRSAVNAAPKPAGPLTPIASPAVAGERERIIGAVKRVRSEQQETAFPYFDPAEYADAILATRPTSDTLQAEIAKLREALERIEPAYRNWDRDANFGSTVLSEVCAIARAALAGQEEGK